MNRSQKKPAKQPRARTTATTGTRTALQVNDNITLIRAATPVKPAKKPRA